jgi:anti-sigma factor RsiW
MLEYLYGLLESDELQAFRVHLDGCATCQAEMDKAKRQQQLLAKAARMEFPEVRFKAPTDQAGSAPAVLLLQRPSRPRRWRRWAAAAAVLLFLGAAAPAVWYGRDYRRNEETVAEGDRRIVRAQQQIRNAEARIYWMPSERQKRTSEILNAQRESQLRVKVQGPATLRVGAPTDYQIVTTDLNGQPTKAKVSVELKDRDQPVGKPIEVASTQPGVYHLALPPDLPVRPGSQPTLVVSASRENGSHADLHEELQLAAPVYVTHLEIDKPMYQLGETVHFRSLTLDRFSLKPAEEELDMGYVLTMPGGEERVVAQGKTSLYAEGTPPNKELLGPDNKPLRGIGAGSFPIDAGWGGGEYTLKVREINGRVPEERRKFLINKYDRPRLNKELDFSRKSYGPGDEVVARCKAKYLDGRPVKSCAVRASVKIDGRQYGSDGRDSAQAFGFQTDEQGVVNVRFKLPSQIERGKGSVSVEFADPAMPDTLVRPIPIVLKKLDVEFCPEGGDLVAGLPNRVYFQVRSTLGKPADLKGQLLEDGKPLGVTVETLASEKDPELNQGTGRFEFTPKPGHKYAVKVESPAGIAQPYAVPDVQPEGVVLSVPQGVIRAGEAIPVIVRSTASRSLLVGAYCRGRLLDSVELDATHFTGNEARATLKPTSGAGGVCRVTVFDVLPGDGTRRALIPRVERLIYREPAERVNIALKPDQKAYVPRQTAKVGVEATTEKGQPAPAVVLLRVIDKSVMTLADDKTLRAMPTHFLLTTEVRRPEELEYADFLLGSHPRAAEALDLLLGTQGWRRFAEQNPDKFRHDQKEEAERLLVTIGQSQPQTTDLTDRELTRVDAEYKHQTAALTAHIERTRKAEAEARADEEYRAAVVALANYRDFFDRLRLAGAPVLGALLVLAAFVFLILGLFRKLARALPYYAVTAACVAGIALLLLFRTQEEVGRMATGNADREMARAGHLPEPKAAMADRLEREMFGEAVEGNQIEKKGEAMHLPMAPPAPMDGAAFPPGAGAALGGAPRNAAGPPMAMPGGQGMMQGMGKGGKGIGGMMEGLPQAAAEGKDKERLQLRGVEVEQQAEAKKALAGRNFRFKDDRKADEAVAGPAVHAGAEKAKVPALRALKPMGGLGGMGMGFDLRGGIGNGGGPGPGVIWPPMPVRVFAHTRANGPAEVRFDFAETLYWHPVLVLPGGKADVSFDLCDSLGAFEVTAFAHTPDGRLGSATQLLTSRLPLAVQPRIPLEVTAGDTIDIALSVANNTRENRTAHLSVAEHGNLSLVSGPPSVGVSVPAEAAVRKLYRFRPTVQEGEATLAFTGKADGAPADTMRTTFRVVPEGFPILAAHSDVLEKSATQEIVLPTTWIKGTLKCRVEVYPSTLADLQKGLESLLREPCGCFEQTSTSNYPNLLILQYLKESDQTKPEVERRARELLDRGYRQLTSFECLNSQKHAKEGYEWFGGTAPAHEALTAYGLMEFRDMAKVHEVDPAMLKRTQQYLMSQRDGNGGFRRNPRALDTFGRAPDNITNAYIVWALTEGGKDDDITKELNALHDQAKTSTDPYFLALVANSLINRAKTADAVVLLKKVAGLQKDDGHLDAAQTSITGSGGRDLQIETTALAVLGWLKANPGEFNAAVQKAIRWIGQQRGGYGGFGSTQSTILALKALILYTNANKKTPEAGELRLFVGEHQVAMRPFAAGATEPLTLSVPDAEKTLKSGKNTVRVEITGKNVFPYTLSWSYQTRQPASAENCPVKLAAKLDRTEAREGETVQLTARVENVSGKGQGMTVAILGLPGGLTIPEDMKQLKDYTRQPSDGGRPLVSHFEIRGRELVLYWRDLAPDQKIEVPIDLICRVPGEYSGPASRAYLYYNADYKHWVEPLKIAIAAKAE